MRQDDAGEFLQLLLASSAELREMFAQETFHEDTYVPQCSACEGRVVPTAEHEVLSRRKAEKDRFVCVLEPKPKCG